MENLTSAISVQVDLQDKENANEILKTLGLNMSTFVNMAIKQLLYTNGLPFEVKSPIVEPNIKNNLAKNIVVKDNNYHESLDELNTMPDLVNFINEK